MVYHGCMAGVSAFARAFDVQPNTVRRWTAEFSDYLSPEACPEAGETRRFNEDDARVMSLVGQMRAERKPFAEIHAALLAGERAEFMETVRHRAEEEEEPSRAITTQLLAAVAQFEGELKAVRSERDRLVEERDRAQAAMLAAEIRAAKLEAQLEDGRAAARARSEPPPSREAPPEAVAETMVSPAPAQPAVEPSPAPAETARESKEPAKTQKSFFGRIWAAWVYLIEREVPD